MVRTSRYLLALILLNVGAAVASAQPVPEMVAPTMLPPADTAEPPLATLGFEPRETAPTPISAPRPVGPLYQLAP